MSNVSRHFKRKGVMKPMILRDRLPVAAADSQHARFDGMNRFAKNLNRSLNAGRFTP
jgi:hypothetical protein